MIALLAQVLGLVFALWVFFLAVMTLKRAKKDGTLSRVALVLGVPVLVVGYTVDFIVNVLVMTPCFFELPREWTVTARLKRHETAASGWRRATAHFICVELSRLDPSGRHCN